jgi:hypothetical protein
VLILVGNGVCGTRDAALTKNTSSSFQETIMTCRAVSLIAGLILGLFWVWIIASPSRAETPLVRLAEVPGLNTRTVHESIREGSPVAEHSETYKGRRIMVRPRTAEATTERAAGEGAEPELLIDNQPVFTIQNSSGAYIASGFAFDPQPSLVELAKRMIDHDAAQ